jgi:hypothetical protein
VVTPLISNASEIISSVIFAGKKTQKSIVLTYSQVRRGEGDCRGGRWASNGARAGSRIRDAVGRSRISNGRSPLLCRLAPEVCCACTLCIQHYTAPLSPRPPLPCSCSAPPA